MERRIFLAVVLSIAILWLWAAVAPKFFPELAVKPKPRPTVTQPDATPKPAVQPTDAPQGTPAVATAPDAKPDQHAAAPTTPASPVAPVGAPKITITTVATPDFVARFSNRGAQLVSFQLLKYRTKKGAVVDLVKARDASRTDYPFAIEARDARVAQTLNSSLYAVTEHLERGVHVLEYRFSDGKGLAATKTFRVAPEFLFQFSAAVTPAIPYRIVVGPGIRTLAPEEVDSQIVITGDGLVQRDGKLTNLRREKGSRLEAYEQVDFVGIQDNYFLIAMKPVRAGSAVLRKIDMVIPGVKDHRKDYYAGLNAAPDGVVSGSAFFGPKQTTILERYGLERTLQFGMFGVIARVLLDILIWLNKATKNYGFAIIVLTIIIKIVLYPLQHKSIVSMKKMQKVQPKMEAIKQRYKKARTDPDQRQKMNTEMMKLYQQEGINPMGGCLPIVLQLPILWAFYGLLSRAIELRGAPFILWIHDLSDKDPYYITPILMTATMFIQTAMTPSTADPAQKRMFMMMPLIFGWIFKEFPSGLVLYWLVQNILTIIQQTIMNKYWKDHPKELQSE